MSNTHNSTSSASKIKADSRALKNRFAGLKERIEVLASAIDARVSARNSTSALRTRPLAQQRAFVLAVANLKMLREQCQQAEAALNGIDYYTLTAAQRIAPFYGALAGQARMMIVGVANSLNVSDEIVVPACITHFGEQLDMIETVLVRAETFVTAFTAA